MSSDFGSYEFLYGNLELSFNFLVSFLVLNNLSFLLLDSVLAFLSLESGDEPSKCWKHKFQVLLSFSFKYRFISLHFNANTHVVIRWWGCSVLFPKMFIICSSFLFFFYP